MYITRFIPCPLQKKAVARRDESMFPTWLWHGIVYAKGMIQHSYIFLIFLYYYNAERKKKARLANAKQERPFIAKPS